MSPARLPGNGTHDSPPRPLTALVARDRELSVINAMVRDPGIRLLTLTGPGGVGKTRLAIAAAADVAGDFPDGVVFIDLTPVANPDLVVSTIARRLGWHDTGATPLRDGLRTCIGDRRLLLVLDNVEQVVTAAPQLRQLLDDCAELKLLITSRIRLRVSGEREFPVAPLPCDDAMTDDQIGTSGAVQLFVERARDTLPDFSLDADSTPVVAEIVRRVDGIPLAIELAAARIKALPPIMLLQRLEQRLPLLSGGARDLPLRQQTMRDTIGWSYDHLSDDERVLFRRLSVFVGGFTLDAAETVMGADNPFVFDGIASLIEQSLLRMHPSISDEPRYQMLETIREYAGEQLVLSGESAPIQHAHAVWCLAFAQMAEPGLWGAGQNAWLDRLDREKANLRAALRWAIDQSDPMLATRLGALLWRFWQRRGYVDEGRVELERMLAHFPDEPCNADRCSALTGAGVLATLQGDYGPARQRCETALTGWRQLNDDRGIARALFCLATIARFQDDYARAETLGHESLVGFRAVDDRWGIGHVLTHLGMVSWVQGNHEAGTAFYENALTQLHSAGDDSGIFEVMLELGKGDCDGGDFAKATRRFEECLALSVVLHDDAGRGEVITELGVIARLNGDHEHARELLLEATALAQTHGNRRQIAYLAAHLGDVDFAIGDNRNATARYTDALELFLVMGNRVGIAQTLEALARCAQKQDRLDLAIRLLGCCTSLFRAIGATPPPDRDPGVTITSLKRLLPPIAFDPIWAKGVALSPEMAAIEARALVAEMARELPANDVREPPRPDATAESSAMAAIGLSPREIEVIGLLVDGLSDREIAAKLSISERTAGNHVQHAMQKIGVESRTAAAVFAVRHGLDQPLN